MSEAQLLNLFELPSFEPGVFDSLESIMLTYALSAEDLFFKWDAFSAKEKLDTTPTVDALLLLRRSLSLSVHQKSKIYTVETVQGIKAKAPKTPIKEVKPLELLSSPQFGSSAFSPQVPPPRKELIPHKEKGKPVSIFNPHIQPNISTLPVHVNLIKGQQTESYRYFFLIDTCMKD